MHRRVPRGAIRGALLSSLLEGPAHGYEVIRRLEDRSGGVWRPSAGSVYPTLQLLQEQGLLTSTDDGGKRVYELTTEGRAEAERGPAGPGWESGDTGGAGPEALRVAGTQLLLAVKQVAIAGDPAQAERAVAILAEARQSLYRMLGET
ncbi:MAG: PadR family transcriptional regulator [Acidimicrobiales bacterium]